MAKLFLKIVILTRFLSCARCVYSPEKETEIRSETLLAASYDPISRPSAQTHVSVTLSILAIDELDIKVQQFTSAGWLTFEWTDPRLKWNYTAKDDIKYIFAKPTQVWKPEVVIDNSLADLGVIHDNELQIRVSYDGVVDWEPLVLFKTHCDVDITYYPYDEQKCGIAIVSWGYRYDEMKLEHANTVVNLEDYVENGEWHLIKTHVESKNLTDHTTSSGEVIYPLLDFWIYLERRTDFYNLNVMMPVFLTSMLVILVFVVPVASGEKLSYVLTVLLSLTVLLTLVNGSLPSTSVSTSVLGVYLGIVLILTALAVLMTVLILMTHHREGQPQKTSFIAIVGRFGAKVTCLTLGPSASVSDIKVAPLTDRDEDTKPGQDYDMTWKDIAESLNRLCFLLFMTVTVVMNIAFVVVLGVGGQTHDH